MLTIMQFHHEFIVMVETYSPEIIDSHAVGYTYWSEAFSRVVVEFVLGDLNSF